VTTANGTALLQGEELLSAEALIMDLRCRLNEVLEVGASEEVAEVDEFAVVLILDCEVSVTWLRSVVGKLLTIDDTPAVLTATDLLSTDHNGLL
jgi:hypothetical protein